MASKSLRFACLCLPGARIKGVGRHHMAERVLIPALSQEDHQNPQTSFSPLGELALNPNPSKQPDRRDFAGAHLFVYIHPGQKTTLHIAFSRAISFAHHGREVLRLTNKAKSTLSKVTRENSLKTLQTRTTVDLSFKELLLTSSGNVWYCSVCVVCFFFFQSNQQNKNFIYSFTFFFLRQDLMSPRLALNALCSQG